MKVLVISRKNTSDPKTKASDGGTKKKGAKEVCGEMQRKQLECHKKRPRNLDVNEGTKNLMKKNRQICWSLKKLLTSLTSCLWSHLLATVTSVSTLCQFYNTFPPCCWWWEWSLPDLAWQCLGQVAQVFEVPSCILNSFLMLLIILIMFIILMVRVSDLDCWIKDCISFLISA